ncbi:hypothetical protein Taro_000663 [Colocasia esculenta]|uniref:Uncharacterized protein n=1 Tax=Colocasia esculenta TaxID=4460 RepID=A0A843TIE6_COLES|nr:hypothetical protein [Colocasia esculenta]
MNTTAGMLPSGDMCHDTCPKCPDNKATNRHAEVKRRQDYMSGVWVFKDGVYRLVEKPGETSSRRKLLVHKPTGEVITSHAMLETKLAELGWERYLEDPDLQQFHQRQSVHLISLPRDFSKMKTTHMYDLVVKTRYVFEVRDA